MSELEENTSVEQFLHAQSNIGRRQEALGRQEIWCSHWIFTGRVEKLKMHKSIVEKGCNFLIKKPRERTAIGFCLKLDIFGVFFPLLIKARLSDYSP